MVIRGVEEQQLMEALLCYKVERSYLSVVIGMMLKYGLIVELDRSQLHSQSLSKKYLIPAQLPTKAGDPSSFNDDLGENIQSWSSCHFVCSTRKYTAELKSSFRLSQLKNNFFLPECLMERLIGKVVVWTQLTSDAKMYQLKTFCKNYAVFSFGPQLVRLVCIPIVNCIRLDIKGETPCPVYEIIFELMDKCVKEFYKSLYIITTLRLGTASESDDGFVLLSLEAIRDAHLNGSSLMVRGYPPLDRQYFSDTYGSWLNNSCDSAGDMALDLIEKEYRASLNDCSVPSCMQEEWKRFVGIFSKI